ncbi:MAG: hypothetical protein WEB58_12460 [Planctomycetaceae bacterium]
MTCDDTARFVIVSTPPQAARTFGPQLAFQVDLQSLLSRQESLMQIGGLGGIGFGGFSLGGVSFGNVSGIGGNMNSPGGTPALDQAGMAGGLSPQMNQLIELMQGMNTAQILMALMLASGGKDDDDKKGGGSDAAMAFLAGLAMASQLNQMPLSLQLNCGETGSGIEASSGSNLNTLA